MTPMRLRSALLAAAALVAGALVTPTPAAPAPAYTVWELVRVKPGGKAEVPVRVVGTSNKQPTLIGFTELAPKGAGYSAPRTALAMFGLDGRWRFYGWPAGPVPPPPCVEEVFDFCGSPPTDTKAEALFSPRPVAGHRYFAVGPAGRTSITVLNDSWAMRRTTVGFRAVTMEQVDATGHFGDSTVGYVGLEHFRSASLPGGPYGSVVFTEFPCDAGQWNLLDGTDDVANGLCLPGEPAYTFAETQRKTTWHMVGDTVGRARWPFRLVVWDFPKKR